MTQDWAAVVDAALNDDHDFDAAWQGLTEAIEQAPSDAALRRLRIRLAEAAGQPREHVADLQALAAIAPDDDAVALELALLQYRWAFVLVDDEASDDEDEVPGEEDDDGEAEEGPVPSSAELLRQQQLQALMAMSARPGREAAWFLRLLEGWDECVIGHAWQQLVVALRANATHPADAALHRHLWRSWQQVTELPPDFDLPEGQVPVGFCIDLFGQPHDALMAQRALQAMDEALARDPDNAEVLSARAHLQQGLSRLAAAAADHAAAAAAHEARGEADEAAEARRLATLCTQGRAALANAWTSDIDTSVERIGQLPQPEGAADPDLAAFMAEMHEQSLQTQASLREQFELLRSQLQTQPDAPDEQARAELAATAERVAGQLGGALAFEPLVFVEHAHEAVAAQLNPQLLAFDARMQALGIPRLAWAENPAYTTLFRTRALTGIWPHPSGDVVLLCSAAGQVNVAELETELDDGRQFITTASRGRNFFGGGPRVDVLHADASLPLEDWVALHQARVALALARSPGVAVKRWRQFDDFVAAQERQRQAKMAHRLAVGLDDFEALAIPSDWPEHFVPMVQAAALAAVERAARYSQSR